MAEGVPAPGLFADARWHSAIDRLNRLQLAAGVVARGIEPRDIDPLHLGESLELLLPRFPAHLLQGVDEGRQQQLAVTQQHHIKEGGQGFRVGGQHRSTAKHDRIVIPAFCAPQRDALLLQQIKQHRAIQLPAQRETKQIAVAMRWVPLIGEQAPHVEITAAGQAGPNHLVAQAGDAHRVGAGEGQHSA